MKKIKSILQSFLNSFGYKIQRQVPVIYEQSNILCMASNCNLLFDIGANTGQYAEVMFKTGFLGKIVSVEPQLSAHKNLLNKSKGNPNWIVTNRCVLGELDREIVSLYVSDNSVSSSLLKKSDVLNTFSQVGSENVPMYKFDTLFESDYNSELFFLKLDTQGYEFNILKGCEKALEFCVGIQFEASLLGVYIDSGDYLEILNWLREKEFEFYDCLPESRNSTGRLLEMDILMINKKYV
jgi:FkbM family methyltransferase